VAFLDLIGVARCRIELQTSWLWIN